MNVLARDNVVVEKSLKISIAEIIVQNFFNHVRYLAFYRSGGGFWLWEVVYDSCAVFVFMLSSDCKEIIIG